MVNDSFSLECKIIELLDGLSCIGVGKSKLFDFLADLYEQTGLDIQVSNKSMAVQVGTIYILDDEIATKISNDGCYIAPVCLYVYHI